MQANRSSLTSNVEPPVKNTGDSNSSLNIPSMQELMDNVVSEIPTRWREVGIQLGLTTAHLHSIEHDNLHNSSQCFMRVFQIWQDQDTKPPYKWSTVIDALRAPSVNENRLAKTLERMFGSGAMEHVSQNEE